MLPYLPCPGRSLADLPAPTSSIASSLPTAVECAASPSISQSVVPLGVGSTVRLFGLRARPELNEEEAKIVSYDDAAQRWGVVMLDNGPYAFKGQRLSLNAKNLINVHPLPGKRLSRFFCEEKKRWIPAFSRC